METELASPPPSTLGDNTTSQKRKRSLTPSHALPTPPPAKVARTTNSSHLHINYLVRQYDEALPLIATDDALPTLLTLISEYDGVLQRHESMAGNLGARPIGPMIIKRFERLFDGPPRVLKTHGKEGTSINWLDVVEFARNKPEQFNLEKMRDGVRVCQFYTKQCRVEISEEDFELLRSGVPQKMIPPQPIGEDEEKELGTLEILEKSLSSIVHLSDQVSARARQLNHRLKNRKSAIITRRLAEAEARREEEGLESPSFRDSQSNGQQRQSASPTGGFTAVNAKNPLLNGQPNRYEDYPRGSASTNGGSLHGASAATREELLNKFRTMSDRDLPTDQRLSTHPTPRPNLSSKHRSKTNTSNSELDYPNNLIAASQSTVAIPHTPSSLLPHSNTSSKPTAAESREDNGPYKADMMLRMEQLNRADRVQPPCDRCRRLHMDCLKNLTACIGCTKKHAKCSWKDVTEDELRRFPFVPRVVLEASKTADASAGSEAGGSDTSKSKRDWSAEAKANREVRDEELLGESSDEDVGPVLPIPASGPADEEAPKKEMPVYQRPASTSQKGSRPQSTEPFPDLPLPTAENGVAAINGVTHATTADATTALPDAREPAQPTVMTNGSPGFDKFIATATTPPETQDKKLHSEDQNQLHQVKKPADYFTQLAESGIVGESRKSEIAVAVAVAVDDDDDEDEFDQGGIEVEGDDGRVVKVFTAGRAGLDDEDEEEEGAMEVEG